MDRIITAKDYAYRDGVQTVRERIIQLSVRLQRRRLLDTPFIDSAPTGKPVLARIDFGQWVADCECGGHESVDPDEPIFYCFSCGNRTTKGRPRPVVFPDPGTRQEIERLILDRPVDDSRGTNSIDRAFNARPRVHTELGPLSRSWNPVETVEDLIEQNKAIGGE